MMRRISPTVVLLLAAAGCANAGISDWLNPYKLFGSGKHGSSVAPGNHAQAGSSHSPKSSGHRGSRQLHPSHGSGPQYHPSASHSHYGHAPPAPLLGSLPGSLDDGFKPSFPPGFANPPSYSPNLNPFATLAGHGSEAIAKGPFLPSQLTVYHTPHVDPAHASAPLTKAFPLPANINRGNRYYVGNRGRGPRSGVPPHAAVDQAKTTPDGTGPINPDGTPVSYDQFPGLASEIEPQQAPEYEETPTTPPQAAPQHQQRSRNPFSFLSRARHRPSGPHHHHQHHGGPGRQFGFGRRPQNQNSGPPGGPPSGQQGGNDGPFNIDGSGSGPGSDSGNPFGGDGPSFGGDGPSSFGGDRPSSFGGDGPSSFRGNRPSFGGDRPSSFGGDGPSQNPFGNDGPQQNPFGNDGPGPQQNPFGNNEPTQNLFGGNGPLSGGPGPSNGRSPLAGSPIGGGNRPGGPGGQDAFFATSPGSNSPFAPGTPEQGPGSPFNNPQSPSHFNQGPSQFNQGPPQFNNGPPQYNRGPSSRPGGLAGLFGRGQSSPQGPPRGSGGPGGPNGPQSFFGGQSENDYPEQFGGGNRGTRQPGPDFRPQPNGPPDAPGDENNQNPGFYGALHNSENNPQLSSFFGNNGPQGGPGGPGGPPNGPSQFGGPGGPGSNPYGNTIQAVGEGGPGFGSNQHNHAPGGQRKPPMRFGFRNPLAEIFQGSSSSIQSHNNGPLAMSASGSKPAVTLPVPKGSRLLRPFLKKQPGSIVPLSSPKDPNYRPMSLGASSLSSVTAGFEPETAASGGYHGGFGNGDRILYHVGNHKGPHSYQFGYDTGKGHNRIFRFEEKDGKGYVKGKYGFYDKHGKLNIINYMAHPKHGYHAERGHSHGHY